MNESAFLRNKLLEATIRNALFKEFEKGRILFETSNSVLGTCDCYFSSKKLVNSLKQQFSLKNGLCFTINYSGDDVLFRLVLSKKYLNNDILFDSLTQQYKCVKIQEKQYLIERVICSPSDNEETIMKRISEFFDTEFAFIEENITVCISKIDNENNLKDLHEGAPITVELTKYERNKEARLLCIKHYGATCAVCGFDFGKVYGDNFEGMIEVHHKKPLYDIKEDYVVDPIYDLIPVCPNCHSAIHSKKDGFYTIEELKKCLSKK